MGNLKVLKPALLLNAKCGSIVGRSSEEKKRADSQDIFFLLGHCARSPSYLPRSFEVPNASKEFVQAFVAKYGGQDRWQSAGYDLQTG